MPESPFTPKLENASGGDADGAPAGSSSGDAGEQSGGLGDLRPQAPQATSYNNDAAAERSLTLNGGVEAKTSSDKEAPGFLELLARAFERVGSVISASAKPHVEAIAASGAVGVTSTAVIDQTIRTTIANVTGEELNSINAMLAADTLRSEGKLAALAPGVDITREHSAQLPAQPVGIAQAQPEVAPNREFV
jgi:hypothetical protein